MGESTAAAPNVENKVGDSVASGATLEQSVSFGRFECDLLSWEKWSSFSQNKYLEEVEKFSAPGSVAQKKAYFEAHYKKVASRKAEPQAQEEKQPEIKAVMMNDGNGEETPYRNTSGTENEVNIVSAQRSAEEVEQVSDPNGLLNSRLLGESNESAVAKIDYEHIVIGQGSTEEVEQVSGSNGLLSSSLMDESNESAVGTIECENTFAKAGKEEFDSLKDSLEFGKLEEAVVVEEGTYIKGSQENVKLQPSIVQEETNLNGVQDIVQFHTGFEEARNKLEIERDIANLDASKISQKIIPMRKDRDLSGTKKKQASPLLKKSPQTSTPKLAKPTPSPTPRSASQPTTKKESGLALPRSKHLSAGERKETITTPMHMHLSLSPANSESTPPITIRRSLIMEKMGDKDIVKRAFKTFQNNANQFRSSNDEMPSREKEVSTAALEQKFKTSRKENEGLRKAAEKMDAQKGQLGGSWNSPLARSLKGASMDQRIAKPAPSSIGLLSDGKAEKQREFSNKLEEKSHVKACIHSKSKVNSKATPMPGSHRGHEVSKNLLDKEGTKNKHHLRPEKQR